MASLEPIWNRARTDLLITGEHGEPDVFLLEHSTRVATSALRIAQLPEVRAEKPDQAVIVAAALYHEAGWAVRYGEGRASRLDILVRPPPDNHREQGAVLMEASLAGMLPREVLDRAALAIRTLNDREIPLVEGMILSDAENLDEFGAISLWPSVRRGALEGKGVRAVIDTWRRRKEYQFWTARLNDSFRYRRVREAAEARLDKLERLMEELDQQQQALDITAGSPVPAHS